MEVDPLLNLNSVQCMLQGNLSLEQKIRIKQEGRPTPDLDMIYAVTDKNRPHNRQFNRRVYDRYKWMCGCPITNKLFCFVCLMIKGIDDVTTSWTRQGVDDLKHLGEKAKKHELSIAHLTACIDFGVLGKGAIREQLRIAHLQSKSNRNEEVERNRHILRRLIMCIKFCGAFELALVSRDVTTASSENPDIFAGLINFTAELDSALAIHMRDSPVFKGTSESIQNELLDVVFEVYRTELIKEIQSANFVALEVDETADASHEQHIAIIIRYCFNGQICERFWAFLKTEEYSTNGLAEALCEELQIVLGSPSDKHKLIAQSYHIWSVLSGKNSGVQDIIKRTYPYAHFTHSYSHQFNSILERTAQCHKKIKIFFANLRSFSNFFSPSLKALAVLDDVAKQRLPRTAPASWNFKNRTLNTVHEYQDSLKECLEIIIDEDRVDSRTLSKACDLLKHLNCPEFLYWLRMFHSLMPHVEMFFNKIQSNGMDIESIEQSLKNFEWSVMHILSSTDTGEMKREEEGEPVRKRINSTWVEDSTSAVAKKVCDNMLTQIKGRFQFKDHLSAAKLLDFLCPLDFVQKHFDSTMQSYPMLDSVKLKSELAAIYAQEDMSNLDGVLPLLVFIYDNDLQGVFTETSKLADIICTTPSSTLESERCLFTLQRVKVFLKNTMSGDRLNALAVLSVEKKVIQAIPDFDNKVIEVFGSKRNGTDFIYK